MAQLIGDLSKEFDWSGLLSRAELNYLPSGLISPGEDYMAIRNSTPIVSKNRYNEDVYMDLNETVSSGYRWDVAAQWKYYPTDFEYEFLEKFSKLVKLKHKRSLVSKVAPGCAVPPHWDDSDSWINSETYDNNIFRYIVFLNDKCPGQIFYIGDDYYHNQPFGFTYLWDDYSAFHAGFNVSTEPQYLFHYIGTKDGYDD